MERAGGGVHPGRVNVTACAKRNLITRAAKLDHRHPVRLDRGRHYEARLANKGCRMPSSPPPESSPSWHKLGPVAGAASASGTLTLGSKLLTDPGPGAEDNAGARGSNRCAHSASRPATGQRRHGATRSGSGVIRKRHADGRARIRKTPKIPLRRRLWHESTVGRVSAAQGGEATCGHGRIDNPRPSSQKLMAEDPANSQWQRDQSVCESMLGDAVDGGGNLDTAADPLQKSLDLMKEMCGDRTVKL